MDADASASAFLEAAGFLPVSERRASLEALADMAASIAMVVKNLNERQAGLVLLVGPGWNRVETESEEGARLKRARTLLAGLADMQRLVVLADQQVDLSQLGFPTPHTIVALEAPVAELDVSVFPEGTYRERARELGRVLAGTRAAPLVWRLGVGLCVLGEPVTSVASWCSRPPAEVLAHLVEHLGSRLKSHSNVSLELAVKRALLVRCAMPAASLSALTHVPPEHAGLIASCVGYGEPVRISPLVRRLLSRSYPESDPKLTESHLELASHYRTLDGVASPGDVQSAAQMSAWVERAHHLAAAGTLGSEEWRSLELPCPELYWDRGRALSLVARDYEAAAAVYEECARRFPDDDYAVHYAAFNLARTQKRDETKIVTYFARAVELAPENPWWNHRFITSLIEAGHFTKARRSWKRALSAIDPDGALTSSSTWLFENLFEPVARAWLKKGCWRDARRVVGGLQTQIKELGAMRELISAIERQAHDERGQLQTWIDGHTEPQWRTASRTLQRLEVLVADLPTPAATTGDANAAVLAWSLDEVLVELEFAVGSFSWYARARSAATGEGGEAQPDAPSPELLTWLERVARA